MEYQCDRKPLYTSPSLFLLSLSCQQKHKGSKIANVQEKSLMLLFLSCSTQNFIYENTNISQGPFILNIQITFVPLCCYAWAYCLRKRLMETPAKHCLFLSMQGKIKLKLWSPELISVSADYFLYMTATFHPQQYHLQLALAQCIHTVQIHPFVKY